MSSVFHPDGSITTTTTLTWWGPADINDPLPAAPAGDDVTTTSLDDLINGSLIAPLIWRRRPVNPWRVDQRAARKVRMARKRRRGWA